MEKAISQRIEAGNRIFTKRNATRAGALALVLSLGPAGLAARNAVHEGEQSASAEMQHSGDQPSGIYEEMAVRRERRIALAPRVANVKIVNEVKLNNQKLQNAINEHNWYDWASKLPDPNAPKYPINGSSNSSNRRPGGVNWDGIARCETGSNWSMQGSTYSGGVGFANTTWNGFGGQQFAPNAGQATKEEQIIVAERVYAQYGLSGWGCKAYG